MYKEIRLHGAVFFATDGTMARNYNRDLFKHIEELQREVASLRAELTETKRQSAETIADLRDRVHALEAENANLREENQRLHNDNTRLKRILNNNSKNSSLPHLRKCKNRQKISGGFRNQKGKSCYCIILSIIETAKRKTIPFLQVVGDILSGKRVFALT